MNKKLKAIIIISFLMASILFVNSFFYVRGREIEEISRISDTTEVTIRKSKHLEDGYKEIALNFTQKERLKVLFQETKFQRVFSNAVYFEDNDLYDISIKDNQQEIYINIGSIGGEYISAATKFDGKHLKILNPQWKEELEEILSLSGRQD